MKIRTVAVVNYAIIIMGLLIVVYFAFFDGIDSGTTRAELAGVGLGVMGVGANLIGKKS